MKILISNDDGVHAPGISQLKLTFENKHQVMLCAPSMERSTTGHGFSLHDPLRMEEFSKNVYACNGYPADCVFLGLSCLFDDDVPDLVVSGINRGGNLAQDIYYSGTLAAAREACLRGYPAIGISLCSEFDFGHKRFYYETASRVLEKLIEAGIHKDLKKEQYLNINVPNISYEDLKGIQFTQLGRRIYSSEVEKRLDPRGGEYWWNKASFLGVEEIQGSDCKAVLDQFVSVTILNVFPAPSDEWAHLDRYANVLS